MAKKPSTAMPLTAKSTQAEREAANRTHHQEMADHLISNALDAKHGGHMAGQQGPKGHALPANDLHLQSGAYIPRGVLQPDGFARVPGSTDSDGSGSANANDPATKDYGATDCGDK
jgi:hypothetical protein